MTKIYQAECSSCSYQSPFARDTVMGSKREFVGPKILGDPNQRLALGNIDRDTIQAIKEKRLVKVDFLACDNCGTLARKTGSYPTVNCLPHVGAIIFIGVCSSFFISQNGTICLGIIVGYSLLVAIYYWVIKKNRKQDKQNLSPLDFTCPTCGKTKFHRIPDLVGEKSICPQCKTKNLVYKVVGRAWI